MTDTKKIEEAIRKGNNYFAMLDANKTLEVNEGHEWIKDLISLAQDYLKIRGIMPKEKMKDYEEER